MTTIPSLPCLKTKEESFMPFPRLIVQITHKKIPHNTDVETEHIYITRTILHSVYKVKRQLLHNYIWQKAVIA